MALLQEYLDRVVRVPIRLLTLDSFSECPASFSKRAAVLELEHFLNNSATPITSIVIPETMLDLLRELGITLGKFRQTLNRIDNALVNYSVPVSYLVGQDYL
jgi:hypothetical protein